jgi:hypothetical protein
MDKFTLVAAWWGALIATIVLLFDFYKWVRSGPRIICESNYGWKIMMEGTQDDNEYIYFTVTNTGDRPTTITHQAALYWPTRINKAFCKSKNQFFIKGGLHGFGNVPTIIRPGEIWIGLARIGEDLKGLMNNGGYLYLSLRFSHYRRSLLFEVVKGGAKN